MEGRALPEAIENALRALFCEKKMDLTWESMGGVWGDFHFAPNRPRRGGARAGDCYRRARRLPRATNGLGAPSSVALGPTSHRSEEHTSELPSHLNLVCT